MPDITTDDTAKFRLKQLEHDFQLTLEGFKVEYPAVIQNPNMSNLNRIQASINSLIAYRAAMDVLKQVIV